MRKLKDDNILECKTVNFVEKIKNFDIFAISKWYLTILGIIEKTQYFPQKYCHGSILLYNQNWASSTQTVLTPFV